MIVNPKSYVKQNSRAACMATREMVRAVVALRAVVTLRQLAGVPAPPA